jgi:hypothetical protein
MRTAGFGAKLPIAGLATAIHDLLIGDGEGTAEGFGALKAWMALKASSVASYPTCHQVWAKIC